MNSVTNVHEFGPIIFPQYKKSILSLYLISENIPHIFAYSLDFINAYKVLRKRKKLIIALFILE